MIDTMHAGEAGIIARRWNAKLSEMLDGDSPNEKKQKTEANPIFIPCFKGVRLHSQFKTIWMMVQYTVLN